MEAIDQKHLELINKAIAKLSEQRPYERRSTKLSFGKKEKLPPVIKELFERYDKDLVEIPGRKFVWLSEYDEVVDWLVDNEAKGLFMYGGYGRGKSIMINAIKTMFVAAGMQLPGFHASMLPNKSPVYDNWNFELYRKWKCSYIDELGSERAVNDFGEKFEPFNEIINIAEQDLNILVISSNLNADQFLLRYGNRAMDRIRRLCKAVEFKGGSLRP
jgi:DNA replication protein DnaC